MGGTFTIWMAQPRILETQVTPPEYDPNSRYKHC